MLRNEVVQLGRKYLDHHGLDNWEIGFQNKYQHHLATTFHVPKIIKFTKWYVEYNSYKEIYQTLLHEIAHALVGMGLGHGAVWKAKALEIGVVNPSAFKDRSTFNMRPAKYTGKCNCYSKFTAQRKRKTNGVCRTCLAPIEWTITGTNKVINFNPLPRITFKMI